MNDCRVSLLYTFGLFEAAAVGVSQRYPRDERRFTLVGSILIMFRGHSFFLFWIRAAACTASGLFSTNEYIARFLGP